MKRKTLLILSLLIVITCCSCGMKENKKDREKNATATTTPSAASQISAIFKNSQTTAKENRFENDYIRIWEQKDDNGDDAWMQENLDGAEKKPLSFSEANFLWLTNDWLYAYTGVPSSDDSQQYRVFRIPIDYSNGVTYQTEKTETLFEVGYLIKTEFMVTDDCIVYGAFLSSEYVSDMITYYRYNFDEKKVSRLFDLNLVEDLPEGDGDFPYMGVYSDHPTNLPVTLQNAFFVGGRDGVFRVPFDTLTPVKIFSGEATNHLFLVSEDEDLSHETDSLMAAYDGVVYFTATGQEIMKYDGESETASCVLEEKTLRNIYKKLKLWDEDPWKGSVYSAIEGLRIRNNRLYINVTGIWQRKSSDGFDYISAAEREALLSADLSNLNKWKAEDALSDYILENATCEYLYYWSRESCWNGKFLSEDLLKKEEDNTLSRTCYLYDMGDGKILVSYFAFSRGKKPNGTDGIKKEALYDVDTGKILPLEKDYPAYYQWLWRVGSYNIAGEFYWHGPVYDEYDD